MSDVSIDKLKRALAKDPKYDRFKDVVKKYAMNDELETLMQEVMTLHATRKGRKLYRTTPNPRDIIEASLEDSAYRSRAVEIMMRMMKSQRAIEKAIETVSGYIQSEYSGYIDAKTKVERNRILNSINQQAFKYLNELETSVEIIREFILDCDKAGYALKNAVEGLSIMYKRETVVHSA